MRFTFPATTLASLSGVAYLATNPADVSAKVAGLSHETSGSIRAASKPQGAECSFLNGFKVQGSNADTGILICGNGETCVEDDTSSAGGRCVLLEEEVAVESHRELVAVACTYLNGTSGIKCDGLKACTGIDQSKVGCGSCNGPSACLGWFGDITVGENSCRGPEACRDMYTLTNITVGDNSCHDNVACKYVQGTYRII
jgi:hypothetical protein